MSKKYFGTDGIRGRVSQKKINGEMFFKFGLAAGTYFKNQRKKKQTAIIAKDTRLSGYTLEPALVSGLTSAGMHVFTLGPLPTNGLAMLTKKMRANMGIMITASHNPFYDNGLKLFGPDGLKLSDKFEKKIEKLIDSKILMPFSIGSFSFILFFNFCFSTILALFTNRNKLTSFPMFKFIKNSTYSWEDLITIQYFVYSYYLLPSFQIRFIYHL